MTTIMTSRYTDNAGVRRVQVHLNGSPMMQAYRDVGAGTQAAVGVAKGIERDLDATNTPYRHVAWDADTATQTVLREVG